MYSRNAIEDGEQEERAPTPYSEPDYDPEAEMEALIASWWSDTAGQPLTRSLPRLGVQISEALEQAYIAGAQGRGLVRYSGGDIPPH